jgi:SHS2 domain-containing protein
MHRWVDHTSELQLEIEASSEREVLDGAIAALREHFEEGSDEDGSRAGFPDPERPARATPTETREFAVAGRDRAALLADLLGELVFAAEADGFVPVRIAALESSDQLLTAVVEGYRGRPRQLIKGVTYHALALEAVPGGWRARVVFDV